MTDAVQQVHLTEDQWAEFNARDKAARAAQDETYRVQQWAATEAVLCVKAQTDIMRGDATLRDKFAMTALEGLLAGQYRGSSSFNLSEVPAEAYAIADAMLEARK